VVEQDLEDRRVPQAPLRLYLFDQPLEGQVLMGVSFESDLPDPIEQTPERELSRKIRAERQGVDEESYETFDFQAVAVGDRHSHDQVALAAQPLQQELETG
jgi:hypothetical protein